MAQPDGRNAQAIDGASPSQHAEYSVLVGCLAKGNGHVKRCFVHQQLNLVCSKSLSGDVFSMWGLEAFAIQTFYEYATA
jgi:hypothetical protein